MLSFGPFLFPSNEKLNLKGSDSHQYESVFNQDMCFLFSSGCRLEYTWTNKQYSVVFFKCFLSKSFWLQVVAVDF